MKIKLSKSNWETIGRKAGWMKAVAKAEQQQSIFKKVCPECHGKKFVLKKIKNLGTLDYRESFEVCDTCQAKGYITEEDINAYRHRAGIAPHPHN